MPTAVRPWEKGLKGLDLAKARVPDTSPEAAYVGRDLYTQAGGVIVAINFDSDNVDFWVHRAQSVKQFNRRNRARAEPQVNNHWH